MLLVVGVADGHLIPEVFRVIHFARMTKLVDQNVVYKFKRQLHERDIEADRSVATAASPSAAGM